MIRSIVGNVIRRILHSSLWLIVFKLLKFTYRRLYARCSELQRLCLVLLPASIHPPRWYWFLRRQAHAAETQPLLDDQEQPKFFHLPKDACRTIYRMDRSFLYSTKLIVPRRLLESEEERNVLPAFVETLRCKRFPSAVAPEGQILFQSMIHIKATFQLLLDVNSRASTKYDSSNPTHEKKLMELFRSLLPDETLDNRISAKWKDLGFQGMDPATDFRGMGALALDQLYFFAKTQPGPAKKTLSSSHHPVHWYQWACVGINVTAFVLQLLRSRNLQLYLLRALDNYHGPWPAKERFRRCIENDQDYLLIEFGDESPQPAVVFLREKFNELFCWVFYKFDHEWSEKGATIMEFPFFFAKFKETTEELIVSSMDSSKFALLQ